MKYMETSIFGNTSTCIDIACSSLMPFNDKYI